MGSHEAPSSSGSSENGSPRDLGDGVAMALQRQIELEDKEKDELQSAAAMRRSIFTLMISLAIILIMHFAFTILVYNTKDVYEHPYACLTPNCQRMSAMLQEGIDKDFDPCEDFYAYACNKYIKTHPIRSKNHTYKEGIPFSYSGNKVLGRILKRVKGFPSDQFLLFYQGCMHRGIRNKIGFKPFATLLSQLGLLYVPQVGSIEYNIASLIVRIFHKTNKLFFFELVNIQDNMIVMSVSKIEPELLTINAASYYEIIRKSFRMMKDELFIEDLSEIDTIAYLIMRFEAELAHIQSKGSKMKRLFGFPNKMQDEIHVPDHLHENFNSARGTFEWEYFVRELLDISNASKATHFFNYYHSFLNREDRYYSVFMEYFLKQTPYYVIFRYLQWSLLKLFAFDLTSELEELLTFFYRSVGESDTEKCFRSAFYDLHVLAASRFAEEIEDVDKLQANMAQILDNITETLIDLSSSLPLGIMESIRDTLTTIKITQSYDKELSPHLAKFYEGLAMNNERHFANVIKARSIKTRNALKKLLKEPYFLLWPRGTYGIHVITYASIADQEKNVRLLNVPFGAMQEPYMGNDLPILNYAGFGFFVVAYHLMLHIHTDLMIRHGKDRLRDEPCQFVQAQKLLEAELLPRWECIYEEHSKLFLTNMSEYKLNPYTVKSRHQALAHPTALELLHEVVQRVKGSFPKYQILPEMSEYSPEQLFFLSIARQLCRVTHKEKRIGLVLYGPMPFELKVKGSFRNTPAFAEAFNCPKNAWMNPKRKCKWFTKKNPIYDDPKYLTCPKRNETTMQLKL